MNNNLTFIPGKINMPMEFDGTLEQKIANQETHNFFNGRCMECDCRPFGRVAGWPCGEEVPRVFV